jgi:S1-C subfamily serine protease
MALINCPECSNPVSDKAASCPKCARPFDRRNEMVMKLIRATVRIEVRRKDGKLGFGTGFVVGDGRFVMTAYHVVRDAEAHGVKAVRYHPPSSETVDAPKEIAVDSWSKGSLLYDLGGSDAHLANESGIVTQRPSADKVVWALDISTLHLESVFIGAEPLEFEAEPAAIGEDVFFIGYPGGRGASFQTRIHKFEVLPLVTKAVVAFATTYGRPPAEECYYWLDRPAFPGNSGGPVVRVKTGKIIGVISSTPFMPKTISSPHGKMDVHIPDGYAIAMGTMMQTAALTHIIKRGSWRDGVKPKPSPSTKRPKE